MPSDRPRAGAGRGGHAHGSIAGPDRATHLQGLRRRVDDDGWIRTLMDAAENEHMRRMTFVRTAWPTAFDRRHRLQYPSRPPVFEALIRSSCVGNGLGAPGEGAVAMTVARAAYRACPSPFLMGR